MMDDGGDVGQCGRGTKPQSSMQFKCFQSVTAKSTDAFEIGERFFTGNKFSLL